MSEVRTITLRFHSDDFDDEDGAVAAMGSVPREPDCTAPVEVEEPFAGQHRLRVVGSAHLSPFGPLGPSLDDGDVIDVVPLRDGSYRFTKVVSKGEPWKLWASGVHREVLMQPNVQTLLSKAGELGGTWEWVVGNLYVQFPNELLEDEQPEWVSEFFESVRALVLPEH